MKLHLLLNRDTQELIVVTHETYSQAFATDNTYIEMEFIDQLRSNQITLSNVLYAFAEYINAGIQVDFLEQDQREEKTKILRKDRS